jgi:hypothetical protein
VDGDDLERGAARRYIDAGEAVVLLTGDAGGGGGGGGGGNVFGDRDVEGGFDEMDDFDDSESDGFAEVGGCNESGGGCNESGRGGGGGGDDDDFVALPPRDVSPPASSLADNLSCRNLDGLRLPQCATVDDALLASMKDKMSSRADRLLLLGNPGSFTNVSRDELRLMKIVVDNNLPDDVYDELRRWARDAESNLKGLRSAEVVKKGVLSVGSCSPEQHTIEIKLEPPVGGQTSIFFVWTSIIDNLKEMLSDPLLQEKCGGEMLLRAANLEGDEEIISEMNQGEWWRRTQQEYCGDDPLTILGVFNLYIDKTHCVESGTLTSTPIIMACNNYKKQQNRDPENMRCLGNLPCWDDVSSKEKAAVAETKVLLKAKHTCLAALFEEMRPPPSERAFFHIINGQLYRVVPVCSFITNDTAEADDLALHYSGQVCQLHCRFCLIAKHDRHLPVTGLPRLEAETMREVLSLKAILDAHKKGQRDGASAAREELKKISIHPLVNAFWGVDFGVTRRGIYGALPPEVLHQLEKGLMMYYHIQLVEEIRNQGGDALVSELDRKARLLAPFLQHQSERSIKTKSFHRGISDIPKLSAQEMPAVLLMIIACVGDDDAFLPRAKARQWTSLAWSLLILRSYLMADDWTKQMRDNLTVLVKQVMGDYTAVVGESRSPGDPKEGVAFPKFHLLMHFAEFLAEFGPCVISYSGFNEKGHRYFAKRPAVRTQRRVDSFIKQIRDRLDFLNKFTSRLATMEAHLRKWLGLGASPAPSSTPPGDEVQGPGKTVALVGQSGGGASWIHPGALKAIVERSSEVVGDGVGVPRCILVHHTLKKRSKKAR